MSRVRAGCSPQARGTTGSGPPSCGQPVFVPGTMETASYVMTGSTGNRASDSCCHGAGRVWSRHRAHRETSARQVRRELVDAGVAVRPASWRSVVEEAPEAYKDVGAVVRASEHNDLGRLVARLVPLGVLKDWDGPVPARTGCASRRPESC